MRHYGVSRVFKQMSASKAVTFASWDLVEHIEWIIKNMERKRRRVTHSRSDYSWLKSRNASTYLNQQTAVEIKLVAMKISPSACAAIAIRLDGIVKEQEPHIDPDSVIAAAKKLLDDEHRSQLMLSARTRPTVPRTNRVVPELHPPGREPTVSFLVEPSYVLFRVE